MNPDGDLRDALPPHWQGFHRVAGCIDDAPDGPFIVGSLVRCRSGPIDEHHSQVLGTRGWVSNRFHLYGFSLVLAGEGRLLDENGHLHVLRPGHLFRVYSRGRQVMTRLVPGPGWAECGLWIRGRINTGLARLGCWSWPRTCAPVSAPSAAVRRYVDHHQQVLTERRSGLALLRRTCGVVDDLIDLTVPGRARDDLVERARRLLAAEPDQPEAPDRVAAALGVAPSTLNRRFREQIGLSPARYQLEQRMLQAAALLDRHSVQKTARLVGYHDPASFSRRFKAVMGVAPSRYRGRSGA